VGKFLVDFAELAKSENSLVSDFNMHRRTELAAYDERSHPDFRVVKVRGDRAYAPEIGNQALRERSQ